jgi:carbonic anhydrase/acetyltransferase-like protein (isoleucine patch superfamily)
MPALDIPPRPVLNRGKPVIGSDVTQTSAQRLAPRNNKNAAARGGEPYVLPYHGALPTFASPPEHCGADAAVLGRATLGRDARLGTSCVIRADGNFIRAGDGFTLGDRSTIHIEHDLLPAIIGDRVTVGTNAVVHACTLGNDIVVGDGAVVLDGSEVPDNVLIEPHAVVFPRSRLESGKAYSGMPARPVRDLMPGELARRADELRARAGMMPGSGRALVDGDIHESVLVAATARLRGRISAAQDSSIWFGCELDSGEGEIAIGARTNIQDNTLIRCRPAKRFEIGADCTIGHNVTLGDCTIGARCLIGIGSVVANGTVIEDEVFLAAGAETTEGQVLEGGWLWGKRPAAKIAPLDEVKRKVIAIIPPLYVGYAQAFDAEQRKR